MFVEGRASIADLYRGRSARCGIYILAFNNGDHYVGQSTDVTRRFVQHLKAHKDIQGVSFRRVARRELDSVEREIIEGLQSIRVRIRNIILSSQPPMGKTDFDLVMSARRQQRWLSDARYTDSHGKRPIDPDLRRKYEHRWEYVQNMPHIVDAVKILRLFVQSCIPAIRRSEISFWSCTCPAYMGTNRYLLRINVNWQEVFTVYPNGQELQLSWHLARTHLQKAFGPRLTQLKDIHPWISITKHRYVPGGPDQVELLIDGAALILKLIRNRNLLMAARAFNLRLMQKGPNAYSRYHCLSLADELVD